MLTSQQQQRHKEGALRVSTKPSGRQRLWLAGSLLAAVAIVGVGALRQKEADAPLASQFTVEMSLKEMAPQLNVTGKNLARELGLPLDTPKGAPVSALGVTQDELDHAIEHILGHRETMLKYHLFAALALFGLVYLVRLGRPDGSPIAERKSWYPRWPYLAALVVAVGICGFALGKSPNPMESAVKVFKSLVGLYPSVADKVWAFGFFAVLAVVGSKLICGWACPFGALQELIYHLPILRKLKKRRLPFAVSNSIRSALFVATLLILFGLVGGREGFVIYHYMNPFNLFNRDIETVSVGATIVVALVLSFGSYRPFCQFICPFGLLSWLLERVSVFRVKIDRDRCTHCGACVSACPLDAAKGRVAGKAFPADCFSCGRCLNVCPADAIHYGLVGKRPAKPPERSDADGN
jgi:ferredoxin